MIEKDNFALVPKSPGALEKAEPGAKRILSGMVAETLALAKRKPLRIFIVDLHFFDVYRVFINSLFKDVTFTWFQEDGNKAWQRLSGDDPDLLITEIRLCGMSGIEIIARLAQKKVKYPVLVITASETRETDDQINLFASQGLKVKQFLKPFGPQQLRLELEKYFGPADKPSPKPRKEAP
jgi:CheY-like chemotaxis protein